MSIPLICIAALAFLTIGLGFAVSSIRAKTDTLYGVASVPDDSLYKMVRAHGNTTEYVPILALLIFILSLEPQSTWVLWCMGLVTLFRFLIVLGIILPASLDKPNPMRFVGALGTYLGGFGLCIALLLQALR